jgi:mono/diheme cytochrome c family protein
MPRVSQAEEAQLALGEKLYKQFCAQCHGEKGMGDGINAQTLDPVPRDMTDSKEVYMAKLTDAEIAKAIAKGGAGIEKSPKMPPFGYTLSEYEIGAICLYVRTLHPNTVEAVNPCGFNKERPKTVLSKVEIGKPEGEKIIKIGKGYYKKNGCDGCHKIDGRGGESGPALDDIASRMSPTDILRVIKDPLSVKTDSAMPNPGLSDEAAVIIIHYLMSLKN